MGFLDRLLGREKKEEGMPAEPQMREDTPPTTGGMSEAPPEPAEGMGEEPGPQRPQP